MHNEIAAGSDGRIDAKIDAAGMPLVTNKSPLAKKRSIVTCAPLPVVMLVVPLISTATTLPDRDAIAITRVNRQTAGVQVVELDYLVGCPDGNGQILSDRHRMRGIADSHKRVRIVGGGVAGRDVRATGGTDCNVIVSGPPAVLALKLPTVR